MKSEHLVLSPISASYWLYDFGQVIFFFLMKNVDNRNNYTGLLQGLNKMMLIELFYIIKAN